MLRTGSPKWWMNGWFLIYPACSMLVSSGFHSHYCTFCITLSFHQHRKVGFPAWVVSHSQYFQFYHWRKSRRESLQMLQIEEAEEDTSRMVFYCGGGSETPLIPSLLQLRIFFDFFIHKYMFINLPWYSVKSWCYSI